MGISEDIGLFQGEAVETVVVLPGFPLGVVSAHPDEQAEGEEEDGASGSSIEPIEDVLYMESVDESPGKFIPIR